MKTEVRQALSRITPRTRAAVEKLRIDYKLRIQTTERGMDYRLVRRGCKSVVLHHLTFDALRRRGLIIGWGGIVDGVGELTNRFYVLRKEYK